MSEPRLRRVELFSPGRHHVEHFESGTTELGEWLRTTAVIAAATGTAATYVLCREQRVIGYYALAMGSVAHRGAPSRLRRGQPDPVPVVLLARLALDQSERGRGLGADLLRDALLRTIAGAREYGARALIVDAIDERAADFYLHYGFLPFTGPQLYRRISDIERALENGTPKSGSASSHE